MMRKPSNWENVQVLSDRQKLPLGAYVCKVKQAKVTANDYGEQLAVLFDIAAGEYTDFYKKDYDGNQNQDKKWKGVLRLWVPKDDGSEKDELTKSILKGFVTAVEKSNTGYKWDWNEGSLTGKLIGVLYRNEEWEYEGKTGWAVRPLRAISTDSVRNGDYTLPKDKPLSSKNGYASTTAPATAQAGFSQVDDDELPF